MKKLHLLALLIVLCVVHQGNAQNHTQQVTAIQYFFNTDPGVGVAGNGAIIAVTPTASINQAFSFTVPPSLSGGINHLYVRAKDEFGKWSIVERRSFFVFTTQATQDISGIQYYFDTDPGVGIAGNGAVQTIPAAASITPTLNIVIPNTLNTGIHFLYIRVQDVNKSWSLVERRPFFIQQVQSTQEVAAMEYYYDTDPGCGNGNVISITPAASVAAVFPLGVPCLSTGTHYLYIRAQDESGRWSLIERDTLTVTSGVTAAVVTPSGPISICSNSSVTLSFTPVTGVSYQWLLDGNDIPGETGSSYVVTAAGNYSLKSICGVSFTTSNVVSVSTLPLVTYYADGDNDGYGNAATTTMDCSQPTGYVSNDDDCNDGDTDIHPGVTETCNLVDDDCDGLIDEGTEITFYVDADGDGYGDATLSQVGCTAPSGYVSNDDDCDDTDNAVHPNASETCNLIDDDCDGLIDEGVKLTFYADADNDGYGNPANSVLACVQPSGYVANNGDCNDNASGIHPGALELCNSIDDNCDNQIDEGYVISIAASSISSSSGNSFCSGGSTLLSVVGGTLGTGADWIWYADGCGSGSPIGTGSSVSVTPTGGIHTFYVRAEGSCNTSACVSISITVFTTPEFTSCPVNVTAGNTSSLCSAIRTYSVSASGNPAPSYTYTMSGATTASGTGTGSGSEFNKGTTLVTVTATNSCGSTICSFSITINDTEGPDFSGCPTATNADVEEGQWGAHVSWNLPTATDNCGMGTITSTHSPGDFFNVGSTVVTYTATDVNDNISICQFYVTVAPPDLLGKVNVSVSSDNIHFSDDNPDPDAAVNVSALVVNNSQLDATNFNVQLKDLYSNTTYAPVTVSYLEANHSIQVNWVITMPNIDAFVPIQITIDVTNALDESNELDNVAVKPIICGVPSSLGTMGVGTNPVPASVAAGSVIQLCGHAEYEDTNPPLADPSVAGASIVITITETGQSFSGYTDEGGNFCIAYRTPITPGLYHYTVEISDNTLGGDATGTFTTTPPPPPPCVKDLVPSIDLSGIIPDYDGFYTVTVGTTFSGTIHVRNNCQSVTQSTTLFIGLPIGTPVPGPFTIPPLAPDQVYDVSLPVITLDQPGNGYISATVDYTNVVAEAYEFNNTEYKRIKILPLLPDLAVISGRVLSPEYCQSGNQLNFIVKNKGVVSSGSYNAVFEFYGNNVLQGTQTQSLPGLSPGEQTILTFPFTPGFLNDSFALTVDTPNVIAELSELNNQLFFAYEFVPCKADLLILGCEYFDVKPADPVPGGTLSVEALIKNIGGLTVSPPFNVNFDFAGTIVTVPVAVSIAPSQTISVMGSGSAPPAPGSYVTVTADIGNVVEEKSESNNEYSAPLCYDFEFTNINCAGEPIFQSTQFYCSTGDFRVGLWNYGVYEASHLEIKFEISGPGLSGWVSLGTSTNYIGNSCECPGDVSLPNSFYFPQTGSYQVRMTLDPDNQYAECDESGNQVIYPVNVVESVDYSLLSSYITPSDLNPDINEVITFNVSYSNNGCAGFSPLELYAKVDDTPLDSVMVAALPASGFGSEVIPNTWSSSVPGMHVFRAIIDHDNQFSESNENNNEATRAIIVGEAPDFHVLTLTSSSINPVYGQQLTFSTDILNEGQSGGSGMLQFLYQAGDDNEVLIDQQEISILPAAMISRSVPWIAVEPHVKIIARVINVVPVESDFTDNEKQLQLNPMSIQTISTDVACADISFGSLQVNITGGESPFTVHWSNGMEDQLITVPSGTYSVTVSDALGITAIAYDTVIDLALPVTWYQDADNDAYGNPEATQYTCEQPSGYVGTGTDCDDTNSQVYPDAPELADGNDNDCDGLIDEGIAVLDVSAGDCEVVYFGYSSGQCHTLTVSANGGATPYTYSWSNGATTQSTSVCPEATTIYTVTVTDNNGATAQDQVTVQVIDISCGNNNDKVLVCHIPPGNPNNPQMICIAPSAVQAHLDHGDYLGICDAPDPCAEEGQNFGALVNSDPIIEENRTDVQTETSNINQPENQFFSIYPNPADSFIEFQLPASTSKYEVTLHDLSGKMLQSEIFESGKNQLETSQLANGVYIIQIRSESEKMITSIVVMH